MGKNKKVIILISITLIIILLWFLNYIKPIQFNQVINDEEYSNCRLVKYDGRSRGVNIESEKDIQEIFQMLLDKKIRKIMPWEKNYKSYYSIATDDNWIVIYDHEYLSVAINSIGKVFKFINPIDANVLEKHFHATSDKLVI